MHVIEQHVALDQTQAVLDQAGRFAAHRIGHVVEDGDIQALTGRAATVIDQLHREAFAQRGVIGRLGVHLVVEQGVAVEHRAAARRRIVAHAGDRQRVAQPAGQGRQRPGQHATADQRATAHRQALYAVRGVEGEAAGLRQQRRIRGTAVGKVGVADGDLATRCVQATQHDTVIGPRHTQGQGRGIGIAVGIADGVGEGLAHHLSGIERLGRRARVVEDEAVAAVIAQDHGAVGRQDICGGILPGDEEAPVRADLAIGVHVIEQHVALDQTQAVLDQAGRFAAHRIGHVVEDGDIQALTGRTAAAADQLHREAFAQRCVVGRLGVHLVVQQGVAVEHRATARRRIVVDPGDRQRVAQPAGQGRQRPGQHATADQRAPAHRQALYAIRCTEGEAAGLRQQRRIRGTAVGEVGIVDNDLATRSIQATQHDAVCSAGHAERQDRSVRIAIGIADGVGEGLAHHLSGIERLGRRARVVEDEAVAAVIPEYHGAVGRQNICGGILPGDEEASVRADLAIGVLVVGQHIALDQAQTVLDQAGWDVVLRIGQVVEDVDGDGRRCRRSRAVGHTQGERVGFDAGKVGGGRGQLIGVGGYAGSRVIGRNGQRTAGSGKAGASQATDGYRNAVDGHALQVVQPIGIRQGEGAAGEFAGRRGIRAARQAGFVDHIVGPAVPRIHRQTRYVVAARDGDGDCRRAFVTVSVAHGVGEGFGQARIRIQALHDRAGGIQGIGVGAAGTQNQLSVAADRGPGRGDDRSGVGTGDVVNQYVAANAGGVFAQAAVVIDRRRPVIVDRNGQRLRARRIAFVVRGHHAEDVEQLILGPGQIDTRMIESVVGQGVGPAVLTLAVLGHLQHTVLAVDCAAVGHIDSADDHAADGHTAQ